MVEIMRSASVGGGVTVGGEVTVGRTDFINHILWLITASLALIVLPFKLMERKLIR
jgi:hypothetical protein